jgi:hypothetical protein
MWTGLDSRWSDNTLSFFAEWPSDFSPGASQNAIRTVVSSSPSPARSRSSRLDDLAPRPSSRDPASVGL